MKNKRILGALLVVLLVVLGCRGGASAQGRRVSPHETTMATVDGSSMFIEYGRPSMRGRTIFGSLVRYDEIWCPGADEATMLSTSRPLKMGSLSVPAGEYSLWMIPTEGTWTLILNKDAHTFHTNHRASRDLGRVELRKQALSVACRAADVRDRPKFAGPWRPHRDDVGQHRGLGALSGGRVTGCNMVSAKGKPHMLRSVRWVFLAGVAL